MSLSKLTSPLSALVIGLSAYLIGKSHNASSSQDLSLQLPTWVPPSSDTRPYNYCQAPHINIETYPSNPRQNARLNSVQIFTRHGDRSPSIALPHENVEWDKCGAVDEILTMTNRERRGIDFVREMSVPEGTRGYWKGNCNLGQLTERGVEQMAGLGNSFRDIYLEGGLEWVGAVPGADRIHVQSTDVW